MKPTIIIDTREQKPFDFSPAVKTEIATLAIGDYSIRGLEHQITIERKSLADLLGSITFGRDRFVRELKAMRQYRFAAILIESTWSEIFLGMYQQQVTPAAVFGSLASFSIRFGVVPIMGEDHAMASQICERLLLNYYNGIMKDYKLLCKGDADDQFAGDIKRE